jgi:prepilin-type processing-associated H-X9-DG protein
MSNEKQLMLAWKLYTDDNAGVYPYNEEGGNPPAWCYGNEDYAGNQGNTNIAYLISSQYAQMGPYAKSPGIFKCPADLSCNYGDLGAPRMRSISMSQSIGYNSGGVSGGQGDWLPSVYNGGQYQCYFKESMLGRPSPSYLFVLVDEHPDSINDAAFAVQMPDGANTTWIDVPTKYHANGCGFGFADGHAEIHHWRHPEAIPAVTYSPTGGSGQSRVVIVNANPDVYWLGSRSSALASGAPNPFPFPP